MDADGTSRPAQWRLSGLSILSGALAAILFAAGTVPALAGSGAPPVQASGRQPANNVEQYLRIFLDADYAAAAAGAASVLTPAAAARETRRLTRATLAAQWLGHASFRLKTPGGIVITDPVFGARASPFSFVGPKRLTPPPIAAADLRDVAVVVISHDHLDHIEFESLRLIAANNPGATAMAPPSVAETLLRAGFADVRRIVWGETIRHGSISITAHRAYHEDEDRAAGVDEPAASFAIESGGRRIFFTGDTGYGPAFRRIGDASGYDLALVPIGAFEPRALVRMDHANPEEAVRIARDLRARVAIGMHWGTYALSDDGPGAPQRRFLAAARGQLDARVLAIGATLVLSPGAAPRGPEATPARLTRVKERTRAR